MYAVAELVKGLATAVCDVMAGPELDDPTFTVDNKDVLAIKDAFIVDGVAELEEGLAPAVCDVMADGELDDPTSTVDDKDVRATDDVCIVYEVA